MEESTPQIEKHLTAGMNLKKRQIIVANFLGGIAWGVGTVIGATVVVALFFSLIRVFNFLPLVGDLTKQLPESGNTRSIQLNR